ncbi:DUF202 domain-containing protein [Melissospora conviva]|uniref:DUF202 domain-containing protein n=1 Tax=Melissospora conviva TaxID=3388432 RepID=UPI003B7C8F2F
MPPDPGRQPERTRLSWRRTALALTISYLLIVRMGLGEGRTGLILLLVGLVVWAVALTVLWPRVTPTGSRLGPGPALPVTALAVAAFALLGVMLSVHRLG